jgi:hypothetical protein
MDGAEAGAGGNMVSFTALLSGRLIVFYDRHVFC